MALATLPYYHHWLLSKRSRYPDSSLSMPSSHPVLVVQAWLAQLLTTIVCHSAFTFLTRQSTTLCQNIKFQLLHYFFLFPIHTDHLLKSYLNTNIHVTIKNQKSRCSRRKKVSILILDMPLINHLIWLQALYTLLCLAIQWTANCKIMSMIFSTFKILWFLRQNKDKTTKKKANRKEVTNTQSVKVSLRNEDLSWALMTKN